jgi:hypothetical protein
MHSMAAIAELDRVVLTTDLPEHGLQAGDLGTVVLVHGDGAGYEVEFCTLSGDTVGVITLDAQRVRPVDVAEIARVRKLAG